MLPTVMPRKELAQSGLNAERFIGPTSHQWIGKDLGSGENDAVAVFFDAGGRARPHTHQVEQLLYFIEGEGVVAIDGGPDQLVPTGTFVLLPANTPHMHGASEAGPACHISITGAPTQTDWLTEVPEAWKRFL